MNNGVLILCQLAELVIFQTEAIASLRAFFLPLSHNVTVGVSLILDNQSFVNFGSAVRLGAVHCLLPHELIAICLRICLSTPINRVQGLLLPTLK